MIEENQGASEAPEATQNEETSTETTSRLAELEAELKRRDETIGSLKREVKDFKKKSSETSEEKPENRPDSNNLIDKAFLRSAGYADKDEVELALSTAKKWGVALDELVDDEDFKIKIDKLRTQKQNAVATNVKGDRTNQKSGNSLDYWVSKGTPPTAEQVPDRAERTKITRAMMENARQGGGKFYNS